MLEVEEAMDLRAPSTRPATRLSTAAVALAPIGVRQATVGGRLHRDAVREDVRHFPTLARSGARRTAIARCDLIGPCARAHALQDLPVPAGPSAHDASPPVARASR